MLTEKEKEDILSFTKKGESLTSELKNKLIESIKNGDTSLFNDDGDELCCDLGIDMPDRYQWTTFDNCRALRGRAADNTMCGH